MSILRCFYDSYVLTGYPLKSKEVTFVVDLMSLKHDISEINNDGLGFWGKNNGDRGYYNFNDGGVKV